MRKWSVLFYENNFILYFIFLCRITLKNKVLILGELETPNLILVEGLLNLPKVINKPMTHSAIFIYLLWDLKWNEEFLSQEYKKFKNTYFSNLLRAQKAQSIDNFRVKVIHLLCRSNDWPGSPSLGQHGPQKLTNLLC